MDTKDKVLAAMKGASKALKTGEIAELTGTDKKDVEKAIKILAKEDKIYSPVRCFWQAK